VAIALACGPSPDEPDRFPDDFVAQYAAARCGAVPRCACDPAGHVDEAMCTGAMHSALDDVVVALAELDPVYDLECLDALLTFWGSADACSSNVRVPYCRLAEREGGVGDPCVSIATHGFYVSTCTDGLVCDDRVCVGSEPSIELQAGEPCHRHGVYCTSGTFCDAGICTATRAVGSECAVPQACDDASWCAVPDDSEVGTCTARAGEGEACDSDSAWDARACLPSDGASRWCVSGTCTFAVAAACGPWL
jgi:hypothetical protein